MKLKDVLGDRVQSYIDKLSGRAREDLERLISDIEVEDSTEGYIFSLAGIEKLVENPAIADDRLDNLIYEAMIYAGYSLDPESIKQFRLYVAPLIKQALREGIARERDIEARIDIVSKSRKRIVFRSGNNLVFIDRDRAGYRIRIWHRNGDLDLIYEGELPNDAIDTMDAAVGRELREYILFCLNNWDYLVERDIAEILFNAKIKVIPERVSDRERLAESIASTLASERVIKTFYISQENSNVELGIYCYDRGRGIYYECKGELEKEAEALASVEMLKQKSTRWVVNEAIDKVRRRSYTIYSPAKHKLVFRGRVFDWDMFRETGDFESAIRDPSPDLVVEHYIPWKLNIELWREARKGLERYIPPRTVEDLIEVFKAIAPKSYSAFLAWVRNGDEGEASAAYKVALLLEVIGYTLYPHDYPFNKAILLVGSGSNGKTTYLRLISEILGPRNYASVNLRDLDTKNNRFAASDLYGKLANISAEPVTGTIDMNLFKQLTGEDPIRFERKFKDAFTGFNYAKMIFAANKLPRITEDTYAFWRRWIVIEFPNTFPPDKSFFNKTFTEREIEATILCSLHAFRLVLERNGFTEKGAKDAKEEWMKRSSPAYAAIKKMIDDGVIELSRSGWVVKDDLYRLYKAYIENRHVDEDEAEIVSKRAFTEELERLFNVRSWKKKYAGKTYNAYLGVKIKDRDKARELIGELQTPNYENETLSPS